ncbi:MAG: ATP-binding cassette domain-containing protein, partial [Boseongicola sp.]|nr:ATP-binding cassette domain-containing protein [Boseongicola sp.]
MSDVSADMKIGVNEGSNESMGDDPGPKGIPVTDRNSPGWVRVFSWVFSICSFGLIASLAVFASFFDSIVIESGERFVVPLLFLGGVTALLGLLLFEFAHARALAGYRPSRGIFASQAQAFAGIFLAGVLTFVHPLAGVGIALGTAVGAFGLLILSKLKRNEPFWDFLPSEAATILAGRDTEGFRLAQVDTREHSLADSVHVVGSGVAFLVSLGITSDLAARLVLSPSAVLSFSLITLLSSYAIIKWVRMVVRDPDASEILPAVVEPMPDPADDHDAGGLSVSGLTVTNLDGQSLLSDIAFRAEPGRITGIIGESGSGKSLLLSSLSDPFGFIDMHVRGRVRINGVDPWQRTNRARSLALSYVPDAPIMLPASGQENLACFMDGPVLD